MYHREQQVQERHNRQARRAGEQERRQEEERGQKSRAEAQERRRRGAGHNVIMIKNSQKRQITGSLTESSVKHD